MNNQKVLAKLGECPCGWILDEARKAVAALSVSRGCGMARKAIIKSPWLRSKLRIEVACGPRMYDGCYYQDRKLIMLVRKSTRGGILSTLIHEIRHAQQHEVLGEKEFSRQDGNPWPDNPLEVDACAAEIVLAKYDPNRGQRRTKDPLIKKIVHILDRQYDSQARRLRASNRKTSKEE